MPEKTTDCRSRPIDANDEEVSRMDGMGDTYLAGRRTMAKALVAFGARGGHLALGFSSLRDYARQRLRIPGSDAGQLIDLGLALGVETSYVTAAPDASTESGDDEAARETDDATEPTPASVEERVATRWMSTENAALIGSLFRRLGDVSPKERLLWTKRAETLSAWKLRRMVRKRIEEAAQQEATVYLAFAVTESARDDFRRARDLASRRAGQWLTEGQTFALVVRRFVRDEDERLIGEKKRQVPDTRTRPGSRYIPAKVKRAVRKRARDRCEVPGCSNGAFLDFMHLARPHRDGGSREDDNLAYGCTTHHFLLDAGVIRFAGWEDGRPTFLDGRGRKFCEVSRGPDGTEGTRENDTESSDDVVSPDAAVSRDAAVPSDLRAETTDAHHAGADGAVERSAERRDLPAGRPTVPGTDKTVDDGVDSPGPQASSRDEARETGATESSGASESCVPDAGIDGPASCDAGDPDAGMPRPDRVPPEDESGAGRVAESPPDWAPSGRWPDVGFGRVWTRPRTVIPLVGIAAGSRDESTDALSSRTVARRRDELRTGRVGVARAPPSGRGSPRGVSRAGASQRDGSAAGCADGQPWSPRCGLRGFPPLAPSWWVWRWLPCQDRQHAYRPPPGRSRHSPRRTVAATGRGGHPGDTAADGQSATEV